VDFAILIYIAFLMWETTDVLDYQCQFEKKKLMNKKMFLMEQELLDAQLMQMDVVDPVVNYIFDQEEKREYQKHLKPILYCLFAGDLLDDAVKEDLKDLERRLELELILSIDQLF
jgi:hypothetical protein